MEDKNRLKGRPPLHGGRRNKKIDVRFTEDEYKQILAMEQEFGMLKADLIRVRVLTDSGMIVTNSRELIKELDRIGGEIGRCGNNINQLAHYSNIMQLKDILDPETTVRFNRLLSDYIRNQATLEIALRKVIRAIGRAGRSH
jgi:hypothetical protein